MKAGLRPSGLLMVVVSILLVLFGLWILSSAPKSPIALLRVLDAAGKPVAGAVITPEGMRTKSGPFSADWYNWGKGRDVPDTPVTTDKNGFASVPYPKYVFERIETGTLCLAVNHPNFVPSRPECVVSTALPAGAPWKDRFTEILDRIQHKTLFAHPDPIVLQKGAALKISVRPGSLSPKDAPMYAQISGKINLKADSWLRPEPGVLITQRLPDGNHSIRVVRVETNRMVWFSEVTNFTAVVGQTNELVVDFKPGVTVRGRLDDSVPRPVVNGRVIAHVWPAGLRPPQYPPQWHSWSPIREDGTFEITSLPPGDLELVAICDGFINTNGPGKYNFHYPQQFTLGTNDLDITLGMEPTASLQVHVTDDKGHPLSDAVVSAWPNTRYGDWSAVIVGQDCYKTTDTFSPDYDWRKWRMRHVDFKGTSDKNGVATVANLPVDTKRIAVEHPQFVLPAAKGSFGSRREAPIKLSPGTNNSIYLQLEPNGLSPIKHY